MVRDYNMNDIDDIVKLFDLHNELSEEEEKVKRKELEDGAKILVYEGNAKILGICSLMFWQSQELGSCAEIIMSVDQKCSFDVVANALWHAAQQLLNEKVVVYLITHYNAKHSRWRDFYDSEKFESWFGIHGMKYKGGRQQESKLTYRNYQESDFELYHTYLGQCFSEMREANDIRPYDVYKNASPKRIDALRKQALENKDITYLFYDGDKFVGSSILKSDLDDIFVVPEYQGQGYGKKIMETTLKLALDRFDEVTLGVVVWNKRAINLYKSFDFEIYRTFEHRRLIIGDKIKA